MPHLLFRSISKPLLLQTFKYRNFTTSMKFDLKTWNIMTDQEKIRFATKSKPFDSAEMSFCQGLGYSLRPGIYPYEAIWAFDMAAKLDPAYSVARYFRVADIYAHLGQHERAYIAMQLGVKELLKLNAAETKIGLKHCKLAPKT